MSVLQIVFHLFLINCFFELPKYNGFVHLKGSLYMSEQEVTNEEYLLFLSETENANPLITSIYNEQWMNLVPYKSYYESYKDVYVIANPKHPVVNVSQLGAKYYCTWLTDRYNNDPLNNGKKVIFRLPSNTEWILAHNRYKKEILKFKQLFLTEIVKPDSTMSANNWNLNNANLDELDDPNSVYSKIIAYIMSDSYEKKFLICRSNYPETNFTTLKHMNSNVSEWLSESNEVMGENWNDRQIENYDKIGGLIEPKSFEADFPSPKIGFRVVMEIIEE